MSQNGIRHGSHEGCYEHVGVFRLVNQRVYRRAKPSAKPYCVIYCDANLLPILLQEAPWIARHAVHAARAQAACAEHKWPDPPLGRRFQFYRHQDFVLGATHDGSPVRTTTTRNLVRCDTTTHQRILRPSASLYF